MEAERKLVRKCVFCGRTRPYNATYHQDRNPARCRALNTPGQLVVEPAQPIARTFEYHGLTAGTDTDGRVVQIRV